jgi:hypothetical protein
LNQSAAKSDAKPAANASTADQAAGKEGAAAAGQTPAQAVMQRKMIYSINLGLKVTDPDKALAEVDAIVSKSQGYVSNMNRNSEGHANIELRIPANVLGDAVNSLKALGTVSNEQKTGQDVTEEYVDVEARIKTLRVEEERLLELLKKAVKLEDILQLEKELSRVRGDLEKVQGRLKLLDNKIDYATIQLQIEKAKPLDNQSPQSTGNRAWTGLVEDLRGILQLGKEAFIWLASNLFTLLFLAVAGWLLYRFVIKKYLNANSKDKNSGHQG